VLADEVERRSSREALADALERALFQDESPVLFHPDGTVEADGVIDLGALADAVLSALAEARS